MGETAGALHVCYSLHVCTVARRNGDVNEGGPSLHQPGIVKACWIAHASCMPGCQRQRLSMTAAASFRA